MFDTDLASGEGVARTVNHCCCGTGGMLTLTQVRIQQIHPQAKVFLYRQDKTARRQRRFGLAQRARRVRRRGKPPKQLNPQTWAIARSDMLILEPEGKDAENIKLGSTISNDQLPYKRFDFQFVNPPYGYEWSKDYDTVTTRDPMQNNPRVPQRPGQRGIKTETLPPLLASSLSPFTFQRALHPLQFGCQDFALDPEKEETPAPVCRERQRKDFRGLRNAIRFNGLGLQA